MRLRFTMTDLCLTIIEFIRECGFSESPDHAYCTPVRLLLADDHSQ